MYIDAKKFDYSQFDYPDEERQRLVERDKEFTRDSYRKWINDNVDEIVERQWEINDIGAVERTGDFIKLLKEAEFTYAIGAYTSTIALVGICAEDLCRFFANSSGHNLDRQTQEIRVNTLREMGAISQGIADEFHLIRRLRNDCLHFNTGFKQKETSELRVDALNALNSIKAIYAELVGVVDYRSVDTTKFMELLETITNEATSSQIGNLGVDNSLSRTRNIFASAFGFDISLNNGGTPFYKTSIYEVLDIDIDDIQPEMTLSDLAMGMPVIVDLNEHDIESIQDEGIIERDIIAATLVSVPNKLETTGEWHLWSSVKKLS